MFSNANGIPRAASPCRIGLALLCATLSAKGWAAQSTPGTAQAPRSSPRSAPWWTTVDTGPFISDTFATARDGEIVALKGIAIKLGMARDASVVFDTELLAWRAGFDGTVQLEGDPWNGNHNPKSHYPAGEDIFYFQNPTGLGWAIDGNWLDPREVPFGPLPRNVGRYRGLFRHGNQIVIHYHVGGVDVLEMPALEKIGEVRAITRILNVGAADKAFEILVNDAIASGPAGAARKSASTGLKPEVHVSLAGAPPGVTLHLVPGGRATVAIAKGTPACRFKIVYAAGAIDEASVRAAPDLAALTHGGTRLFPETFPVTGQLDPGAATKTYAVDNIPLPTDNPWKSPPRFGGFDFFADGKRLAACTWNGDVWIADGIDGDLSRVTWHRFASGMYQTLGLKIVDDVIYAQGRDQITRLHDLNGDGEADRYECFNNDVMVTAGFHEFTFDLETDRAGNFYFSKAMPVNSGGRGFMTSTPHNGTVLKVSRDGSQLERIAWGLRAPGGLGVSPEGVVTTGENEGSWVPACKITWTKPATVTFNGVVPSKWGNRADFAGVLPGAPTDYDRPLCWVPYSADNSSGSQVWVPENMQWDPRHAGEILHLSYGRSSIYRVLREEVKGQVQGGVYRLPIDLGAAVMRARFHPKNGHLYVAGFRGWQTNGLNALQRIRYTGATSPVPMELHAYDNGLLVRFSAALDPGAAEDRQRYSISKWNYVWGPQYGSGRFSIDRRDLEAEEKALSVPSKGIHDSIDPVTVGAAKLLEDGRSVFLYVPKMTPAMQMELKCDLFDIKGSPYRETIYHTVHALAPEFTLPGLRWEDVRVTDAAPFGEPGILMTFVGQVTDVVRCDQLALTVPAGTPPSVFIKPGEFSASWRGMLVVPDRDEFTFSLEGVGTAILQIDGKAVAAGELPLTASVPLLLAKGTHAISCSYGSHKDGEARVRLMWSSPQFGVEPVPAAAFRFMPNPEFERWSKVRQGRELFVAARCIRCHQPRGGMPHETTLELAETIPGFQNIGNRIDAHWLEKWIREPQGHCPSVAVEKASDVAAYLVTQKESAWKGDRVPGEAQAVAAGAGLVKKLNLEFWIRSLVQDRKFTEGGLVEFLQQPALHHPDTVFPDVRLTRSEAIQIAAYIQSKQPAGKPNAVRGSVALGQAIVTSSCAVCHAPAGGKVGAASFEELARADWTIRGCVAENRGSAPNLRLTPEQVSQLVGFRFAYPNVGLASLRHFSPVEYAADQMRRLHCVECHSGTNNLPDIKRAGEKFTHEWLANLIAGKLAAKTRPWLGERMPAFATRATNLSMGLAYQHGMPLKIGAMEPRSDLVPVGAKLAGAGGYSCVACHDAGTQKALQVFEGQGPNLQHSAERLRYDYFQRWMHFPQRIAPTTIMPRYTKDGEAAVLETVLDGNAGKQFEAVWHWMKSLNTGP